MSKLSQRFVYIKKKKETMTFLWPKSERFKYNNDPHISSNFFQKLYWARATRDVEYELGFGPSKLRSCEDNLI